MGIFRRWQTHTQEYMFAWNSLVGIHTIQQLSPKKKEEVFEHYHEVLSCNQVDYGKDVGMGAKYDPFWLSFTLADLGIPPMLGPKTAKWFYVTEARKARWNMAKQSGTLVPRIVEEILKKYGVMLQIEGFGNE